MMNFQEDSISSISQEIIKIHLELTALIQDIHHCRGPLELLNNYNIEGRARIAILRQNIECLTNLTESELDKRKKSQYLSQLEGYKKQLSAILVAFRKANVTSACAIDTIGREDLLSLPGDQHTVSSSEWDKQKVVKLTGHITEKLFDISKHLAETTQRSVSTLETLVTSSDKVSTTRKELEHQQQVIIQSGKLLGKYGRREITDKTLLILAVLFFVACVFYILQKRLFQ